MFISKINCPVPFDQQPLHEYLSLKKSWLFAWSMCKIENYIFGIIFLFMLSLLFFIPFIVPLITGASIIRIFVLDFTISNIVLFLVFIRLYLGWSYIMKRLLSATVFYEESGWYDGQIWVKTSEHLIQDRLIGLYEVMPFILRIKQTCIFIIFIFLFSYMFYLFI
uniref:Ycf36 n=1 Tax=Kuetzingia canaliculata TaxID=228262 RepID=A0A1Z1MQ75_KUECA|nr:hypothetical protein [Kuetzingia canaliculata]ARW67894.1 hypothetical protein [Kuetzingia canaliculata]